MGDSETRATVREMYGAYERRDFERVAAFIHDDVEWMINAPVTVFPFAGPRHGRAAVLEALARIADAYSIDSYTVESVVVDGDRAAVLSDVSLTQRSTRRVLRFRLANFLRFKDGRVIEFHEFSNTFDVVEQAVGHYLTVS